MNTTEHNRTQQNTESLRHDDHKLDFSQVKRYKDFVALAKDKSLSKYEKIGFPDSFREGKEGFIFEDILKKLPNLNGQHKTVLDIGPGCSDLPHMIINKCRENAHTLGLLDSPEMLSFLPNDTFIIKILGLYPENQDEVIKNFQSGVDVIICYSVLHHIYEDTSIYKFLDSCLEILKPEGEMLIGDIPNASKRKRFFASNTGKVFHRKFTGNNDDPKVQFNVLEKDKIDDSILHSITLRAQYAGFDAYVVPQAPELPMSNRRDDIIIRKP